MIAHVGTENIPIAFIHILLVSIVLCLTLLQEKLEYAFFFYFVSAGSPDIPLKIGILLL